MVRSVKEGLARWQAIWQVLECGMERVAGALCVEPGQRAQILRIRLQLRVMRSRGESTRCLSIVA